MTTDVRKTLFTKEIINAEEMGQACAPITRVAAMAGVKKPFAGISQTDLAALFDVGVHHGGSARLQLQCRSQKRLNSDRSLANKPPHWLGSCSSHMTADYYALMARRRSRHRIERHLPEKGDIRILNFTDRQYLDIVRFSDQGRGAASKNPEQRALF